MLSIITNIIAQLAITCMRQTQSERMCLCACACMCICVWSWVRDFGKSARVCSQWGVNTFCTLVITEEAVISRRTTFLLIWDLAIMKIHTMPVIAGRYLSTEWVILLDLMNCDTVQCKQTASPRSIRLWRPHRSGLPDSGDSTNPVYPILDQAFKDIASVAGLYEYLAITSDLLMMN